MAENTTPPREIPAWATKARETLTTALVIKWNDTNAYVVCPFPTCKKLHTHGSRRAPKGFPNRRLSHCAKFQQNYQLVWPYDAGSVAEEMGLEFELDRDAGVWRTVGSDIEDPEAKDAIELLREEDEEQSAEDVLLNSLEVLTLEDPDNRIFAEFLTHCVCGEVAQAALCLGTVPGGQLLHRKDAKGHTALTLTCMNGHLDMVRFLLDQGASIESRNKKGETPLIVSLTCGQIRVATHLISQGASISERDKQGLSVLSHATKLLERLEEGRIYVLASAISDRSTPSPPIIENVTDERGEFVMQYYEDRNPSLAMMNHTHQEKIDSVQTIINACIAQEVTQERIKQYKLRHAHRVRSERISISPSGAEAMVTVFRDAYLISMSSRWKTFGYLSLGKAHEIVFAVSGWSSKQVSAKDVCLDCELWTKRVFEFSNILEYTLRRHKRDRAAREGTYYACHAEMQLMAFVLWHFTALQVIPGQGASEEERASYRRVRELHQCTAHVPACGEDCEKHCVTRHGTQCKRYCGPPVNMIKPVICVTNPICLSCSGFRGRIFEYTGIDIKLTVVEQKDVVQSQG